MAMQHRRRVICVKHLQIKGMPKKGFAKALLPMVEPSPDSMTGDVWFLDHIIHDMVLLGKPVKWIRNMVFYYRFPKKRGKLFATASLISVR